MGQHREGTPFDTRQYSTGRTHLMKSNIKQLKIWNMTAGHVSYCSIWQWWQTSGQSSDRILPQPRKLLRQPNEVLMDVKGGWGSQSRSSSYSASVTERKSQVDVMSPASLLSCLLPLHNWSQISWIFELSRRREEDGEWRKNGRDKERDGTDSHPTVSS